MIVISTLLEISSSVRDIERLLRESPPFKGGEDVKLYPYRAPGTAPSSRSGSHVPGLNTRRNSPAHSAIAVPASSISFPMVTKPWIWRGKRT